MKASYLLADRSFAVRADVATRTCLDCKRDYTYTGWRLDALCPECRERDRQKDLARTTCDRCGHTIIPAPNRRLCGMCLAAETAAACEKWGSE